jgi:LPXTG-site transpeptidase (sortase) family protein
MGSDHQTLGSARRYAFGLALGLLAVLSGLAAAGSVATRTVSGFSVSRVHVEPAVPIPSDAAVAAGPNDECPQMTNPGGGLDWRPSANPGPAPTNGTVRLGRFGVRAPIVKVGIDSEAKMVVPKNARDVAWLDQGALPGRTQNIVIAGHIAYSRVAGSFYRLGELKPGDDIVLDLDGKELHFRVKWNCSFSRDTEDAARIMGYTTSPSLTLISCGGVFDTAARTHTKRIAVRAELVEA